MENKTDIYEFRGKDERTKQWVYGYYVGDETIIEYGNVQYAGLNWIEDSQCCECVEGSIGQFTCTYDKYGHKIYVSDILSILDIDTMTYREYVVEFRNGMFGYNDTLWGFCSLSDKTDKRIIGNIIDNKL